MARPGRGEDDSGAGSDRAGRQCSQIMQQSRKRNRPGKTISLSPAEGEGGEGRRYGLAKPRLLACVLPPARQGTHASQVRTWRNLVSLWGSRRLSQHLTQADPAAAELHASPYPGLRQSREGARRRGWLWVTTKAAASNPINHSKPLT